MKPLGGVNAAVYARLEAANGRFVATEDLAEYAGVQPRHVGTAIFYLRRQRPQCAFEARRGYGYRLIAPPPPKSRTRRLRWSGR
jgi:biotin operon repressor